MIENIHNNQQILQQIEWPTIEVAIINLCHFDQTPSNILKYLDNPLTIENKLEQTQAFLEYLYANDFNQFYMEISELEPTFDAKGKVLQIQKEHPLQLAEINQFALLSELYLNNYQFIKHYFPKWLEEIDYHTFKRNIQNKILKEFRRFVSKDGEVSLDRHPRLAPLFQKQLQLEGKIRDKLNHLIHHEKFHQKTQFNTLDILNDRYVIPIKSDSFNKNMGQIVARSESGNTLFVEPSEVSQLNYQRLEIVIEIQAILSKIEHELTISLQGFINEFIKISNNVFWVDELVTRAKFANKFQLTRPQLRTQKGFKLNNSFHPLIANPVKNDITLTQDEGGLVISGPNTGGKTATLKTLTLMQLFMHYGLFIPCDHGEIYPYQKIFYFGNDNQDLTQGLSSFSAEVKNYTDLLEDLGESNLILIDEIFNSTSSEEASALAVAMFKKIHTLSNAHIVVSSHHQTLKTILHQDKSYASAHVGFNMEDNRPTYKLHYGSPGSSHALRIFNSMTHQNDLFANVYENALHFLDNQVIHYEKLLESLAQKEHRLEKLISENDEINKQLKNQKNSMEGVIKLKVQDRVERAEKKIKKLIDKAEGIIQSAKSGDISKFKQINKHQHEISRELNNLSPKDEKPQKDYSNLSDPKELKIGDNYFCLKLNKTVTLKRIEKNKKDALVEAGPLSIKVPCSSLKLANQLDIKNTKSDTPQVFISKSRKAKLEYDCRGMRLDEFQNLIESLSSLRYFQESSLLFLLSYLAHLYLSRILICTFHGLFF